MARYRLTAPHYLNIPGNQWEYKEVDRTTGKEKRHLRTVPMFLHPEDPSNWNYVTERLPNGQVSDGMIVVTTRDDTNFPKDLLFIGAPTMDMEPLDDDAKIAIAELQGKWKHPINDLPGSFAEQLPMLWQQQLENARIKTEPPTVSTRELDELKRQNSDLSQKLAELTAVVESIAAAPPVQASSARRSL